MSIRRAVAAVGRSRPQHAAIYCRISDDRVGAGLGVARQEEDCRALARGTGWSVARVYTDNDLSAYSGKRRPAYRTLLEDIKSGGLDGVLAWHPDRLHRSPRELEEFIDAVDVAGIPILTVQAGQYDLSTATGRMTARIAGAVARHESEHKSERVRRKHEELAQGGMVSGGGDRPFGYDDDRTTIRASEAALLSDAARRVLAGESIRGIVREWNSRGIRTTAGRPWYTTALRRLLVSGRIAGQREHNGEIVGPAVWKGIIKPIESARLRAVLLDPSRRRNAGARRYLLTGIIYCGLCAARLHARPKADHRRCYVCASGPGFGGCGKIRQIAEPLEDLVVRAVFDVVDRPVLLLAAARQKQRESSEGSLAQGIAQDEAQLASLARAWANREISRVEWSAAREPIEQRIGAAHARLSRDQRTTPVDAFRGKTGALSRRWSDMTMDQQRAVIAAVVERVEIGPAVKGRNFFQPERVRILFRS